MSNIARTTFAQGTKEHKTQQFIKDRLGLSIQRYGGQNALFRDLNRYYLSLSPQLTGRENDRPSNEIGSDDPDLFVPRPFSIVEGLSPQWVLGVFGGHPPIRVYGRKEEWQEKAPMLEDLVTYDFDRAGVLQKSIGSSKQLFKYGTCIAKISHRYDAYDLERQYQREEPVGLRANLQAKWKKTKFKKKERVIRHDGPWIEDVNVYNFHPDPYYADPRALRYTCYRRWADRITLEREDENHRRFSGGRNLYQHLDKIPRMKTSYIEEVYQMDNGDDLGEAMGWASSFDTARSRYTGTGPMDEMEDLVEIVEYWDRDDRVVYLANGETPILDAPNPYDDKELPFAVARCYVLENQFWGYSPLHATKQSVEELNSLRNLNMRQTQLNVMKIWGYDEGTGYPQIGTHLSPGAMIPIPFSANGNPHIVSLMDNQPLPPEAFIYEDRIDQDMMTAVAMPDDYRSGGTAEGSTATQASIGEERSQVRVKLQNLTASLTFASEIARLFISRRQQFLKDEGETIRILGPKGPEFKNITRQDIAGEYDFVPGGQHIMPGRDVLRQQYLQMWSIINQAPHLMEMTDMYELWGETLKMMDFDHPKRFMSPPGHKTLDPQTENLILKHGEWVKVNNADDHKAHIEIHQQLFPELVAKGAPPDHLSNLQQHMREHEALMQEQQAQQQGAGGTPAQEMPGLRGYAGNVPNLENAVETSAGLNSRVRGASGGGR